MAYKFSRKPFLLLATLFVASCGGSSAPSGTDPGPTQQPPVDNRPPGPGNPMAKPGQTDFTTDEAAQAGGQERAAGGPGLATGAVPPGAAPAPGMVADSAAPAGRVADVQEGDIYKVDQNRLFYLNTYRGFLIYDLSDPKKPERLARLPVYGYPIEMYVQGNTVYALLRDALYLTQVDNKPQFERHNVSQLVSIDISDLRQPRIIKTIDIFGHLREGVSRKVEDTIYVVSYVPQSYRWGWRAEPAQQKEQAWVYSFNVANPANVQKVAEYKVFEGGSVDISNATGSFNRNFSDVYISATANALMVAENWNISSYSNGTSTGGSAPSVPQRFTCGSYNSTQQVRVSLIDISNPTGLIKPHVDFWTDGRITDQFKMTYVNDPVAKTGTFYGILGRQVWASAGCQGLSHNQNTLESWDVSVSGKPAKLDALDFGKPRETVRGTTFDADRKVAYAITAEQIDPLYALDISNPLDLKILSEIDGLSGDMTVFRLIGDKKFLLGIGRDTSNACSGFQDTMGWRSAKIAVSVIDVQDLSKIRLVQRQCVAVKADWVSSGVTQDMDQAHKMLGMHADGTLNVLTVPVSYSKRVENVRDWWWYRQETAVGLMSWDLTRYDAAKPLAAQTVIQNHGSYIHPHGEVRRSIVFSHEAGGSKRRMMINLSDTHVSIADIENLDAPAAQSEIEVAPYYNQLYRFGDYLVEQVQSKPGSRGGASQDVMTFRVKKAGGDMENTPAVATLEFGQIFRVLKHESSLVLFRQVQQDQGATKPLIYVPPTTEALVLDLRNPAVPRVGGKVVVPTMSVPYYMYWCGVGAYWGGFWFGQENNFAMTSSGLVFSTTEWRQEGNTSLQTNKLVFLDVLNPDAPTVSEAPLPTTTEYGVYGLVPDPVEPAGFFVTHRKRIEEVKTTDGAMYTRYKYFAQRWDLGAGKWAAAHEINTPGRLLRTWKSSAGDRLFLSQDMVYRPGVETVATTPPTERKVWFVDYRLALLRQLALGGKPVAELLGTHLMRDLYPSSVLVEGDKLLLNARPQKNYYYGFNSGGPAIGGAVATDAAVRPGVAGIAAPGPLPSWETTSDRLIIMDTSANKLAVAYDQPTRMYNVQLMGTHAGKLFVNLLGNGNNHWDRGSVAGGDGILVIDVSNPAAPVGVRFLRTLGYASHIEFFGDDVYVAAGHFGLQHMSLGATPSLPIEPPTM